jgi:ADP-ribose pyrophosphatase
MSLKLIAGTQWLKLFTRTYKDKNGKTRKWNFSSRRDNPDEKTDRADAVCVVPFLPDGRIVIIKQFRPTLEKYFIETVAGLHDQPTVLATAAKELHEETGLDFQTGRVFEDKLYNSIGISDESCSYTFCNASGEMTTKFNEDAEDIEILALNREEALHLLKLDANFSAKCWLILQAYANGFDWRTIR